MSLTRVSSRNVPTDIQIVGCVEGRSEEEIVGWSWRPGSDERLTVELRFDDVVVASTLADGKREDLSKNGIGDGCHEFRIGIPSHARGNPASLTVYASGQNSTAVLLGDSPTGSKERESFAKLQRGFELMLGSQRVLHRNIQAVLLKQSPSVDNALGDISAAQERLSATIATMETLLIRIEIMFNDAAFLSNKQHPESSTLKVLVGTTLLGLFLSCIALWRSLQTT